MRSRRTAAARECATRCWCVFFAADRLAAGRSRSSKGRCAERCSAARRPRGDDNRARIAEIINNLDAQRGGRCHARARRSPSAGRAASCARCCSRSAISRVCRNARAPCCSTSSRPTSSCWRCAAPITISASPCSRRWLRARGVLSRASSPSPSGAPPIETEKARRQIVKLVLVMAQRGEIELPTSDEEEGAAA